MNVLYFWLAVAVRRRLSPLLYYLELCRGRGGGLRPPREQLAFEVREFPKLRDNRLEPGSRFRASVLMPV